MSKSNITRHLVSQAEIENSAKIFADTFKQMTEIEGIIIKGHIMIERELNIAIENTILNRQEYQPDKFSFSQKLILSQMLGLSNRFKIEIKALNSLRNQIAHSLKYDEKYIKIVIKEVIKKYPNSVLPKNTAQALGFCISYICGGVGIQPHYARRLLAMDVEIEDLETKMKKIDSV